MEDICDKTPVVAWRPSSDMRVHVGKLLVLVRGHRHLVTAWMVARRYHAEWII